MYYSCCGLVLWPRYGRTLSKFYGQVSVYGELCRQVVCDWTINGLLSNTTWSMVILDKSAQKYQSHHKSCCKSQSVSHSLIFSDISTTKLCELVNQQTTKLTYTLSTNIFISLTYMSSIVRMRATPMNQCTVG